MTIGQELGYLIMLALAVTIVVGWIFFD